MSPRKHRVDVVVVSVLLFVVGGSCIQLLRADEECRRSGGVLVEGVWGRACVRGAP